MTKEIDIRALLVDNLSSEYIVQNCSSFIEGIFEQQIVMRDFNNQFWWSTSRKTSFIESVYTGCELPLIIILEISENPKKYLIVDGLNRFLTIQQFLTDKLRLCSSGIKKAAFLENKVFSELAEEGAQEYFYNRGMQILKYSYTNKSHKLTEIEIKEIAKQLYIRYNSGIRLKNEEIQKADYQDDIVTKKIQARIKDKVFLDMLTDIYFTPQKETKTFIESALMYCRLAITSCYSPLNQFCRQKSILNRIDTFYSNYTAEISKDSIFNDFESTVSCLHVLSQQSYFDDYPSLKNQYFMFATYWLLFQIKKNNIIKYEDVDWRRYVSYFGEREKEKPLFSTYHVNMIERYNAIIDYFDKFYKIDLKSYMVKESACISKSKINSFSDLPKYNFQLPRDGITIATLFDNLKSNSYILRPEYQRKEINDRKASSFLIESILLNMNVPDILVYRHENNQNRTIFEVVDGQQRCFSLLGFLRQRYKNFLDEEIVSEKEGFSLTGLNVYSELNGKKVAAFRKEDNLDEKYINKILNGKIRIVYIPKEDNPYFSVRDYFTRINKTIIPLRKTSYRYWNVHYDSQLIDIAEGIANKFKDNLLPKMDSKMLPQQYVVSLSYLYYHKTDKISSFSVQQVSNWLYSFNKEKNELIINNNEDKVKEKREPYQKAFIKTDLFLTKTFNWLNNIGKSMNQLTAKKRKLIKFTDLLYLYYLIGDVAESDLINNSEAIYTIVYDFFQDSLNKKMSKEDKIDSIRNYKDQLSFLCTHTLEQKKFHDKISMMMQH